MRKLKSWFKIEADFNEADNVGVFVPFVCIMARLFFDINKEAIPLLLKKCPAGSGLATNTSSLK